MKLKNKERSFANGKDVPFSIFEPDSLRTDRVTSPSDPYRS